VRKTSVAVDDDLLARASAVLSTRSLRETIQRSLEEVVAQDLRRHRSALVSTGDWTLALRD
jgi:hypothetical protein